jgi:hypothetical protein
MLVNVKGCTVTVEKSVDRVALGAMVLVSVTVRWTVNSADSVTVENTTSQDEQVEGQTSCEVDVSLAALAALAVTTALVELRALVAGLVAVAVTVAAPGIEPGVVVTLLCPAASVYITVDVEVEFKVT